VRLRVRLRLGLRAGVAADRAQAMAGPRHDASPSRYLNRFFAFLDVGFWGVATEGD
jgi:hypothetical protein